MAVWHRSKIQLKFWKTIQPVLPKLKVEYITVRNAKHYEVKLRFLQKGVVNKAIEFEYCPTDK
jgi:hypothetical protein